MRIRVLIFLSLVIFLLCGCESKTTPVRVNLNSISFSADITYYNESYSCDCAITKTGDLTVNITSPENLKDLSFAFSAETCKIMYAGMSVSCDEHFLPEASAVRVMSDILKKYDASECEKNERNLVINGTVDRKKFTLSVSPTGLPIFLQTPDLGMTVNFKNVTLI